MEKILINFLEYRNSLNSKILTKMFITKYRRKLGFKIRKFNFFIISRNIKKIKRRRNLYIYIGKVIFIKIQN